MSPGDLGRFAVIETPVKNHQLTLIDVKNSKGVNNNNNNNKYRGSLSKNKRKRKVSQILGSTSCWSCDDTIYQPLRSGRI